MSLFDQGRRGKTSRSFYSEYQKCLDLEAKNNILDS